MMEPVVDPAGDDVAAGFWPTIGAEAAGRDGAGVVYTIGGGGNRTPV